MKISISHSVSDSFNPFLPDATSRAAVRSEQPTWRAARQTILNTLLVGAPETRLWARPTGPPEEQLGPYRMWSR
jgi:hypothetical protein